MRYGIFVPNFGPLGTARVLADLAADAEAAGWDGFFIWDHIAREPQYRDVADTWVALTAIAMRTAKVRFGALVTPMARRRPWKLARETASLDLLSNGRLIFGAGLGSAGGSSREWEPFGEEMDLKRRGEMLDEGLDVLAGLWSGEPFHYEGKHYKVGETQFLPAPLQQPRIPVWVAGVWPNKAPFRRAARWDGVVPIFSEYYTLSEFQSMMVFLHDLRGTLDNFDVIMQGKTPGGDASRGAEMVAPYAAAGATWWLEDLDPTYFGGDWQSTWTLDAIKERVLQGPPRE